MTVASKTLKPWYKVVTPRQDLREDRPMDASEFAVHLDQVRDGRAQQDYQDAGRFFDRTYLTKNLLGLSSEVVRRLAGIKTETSAVFNMSTQFGGGKTHSLTLLFHLAKLGPKAGKLAGVNQILKAAGIDDLVEADVAVFVGTEFDSLSGRGGKDGTPLRKTPWGEIAFQLGGKKGFEAVAEHEKTQTAPGGDVIRQFLPKDKPCLILMDELMNYMSRYRKSGLSAQAYNFIQNLTEEVRARDNTVLAVSIPASELEMNAEDQGDFSRLKKMLDRLGKAIVMSSESESSEIIRRRLFEWDIRAIGANGKILLPSEAMETCSSFASWISQNKDQLPKDIPTDKAKEVFAATYPFHPMLLSVFERKWASLPRFQQTRGILRLLALWVSRAYAEGFKGAHKDALITTGTAPLEDSRFRPPVFEQLGNVALETAVVSDITGKNDAHAVRLDEDAVDTIREMRLHRKVATTIFFESNGGTSKNDATIPEIRLAVGEPGLDIGNVETALDALVDASYYLTVEKNRYRFSLKENLNKRFSDQKAAIPARDISRRIREEVQIVFEGKDGPEKIFFPEKSNEIPDRAVLALVILPPDTPKSDAKTEKLIGQFLRESGSSARVYKSAVLFAVAEDESSIKEEVKKLMAWQAIDDIRETLSLDPSQEKQLDQNLDKAKRDVKESVWRSYKNLAYLGKDNEIKWTDFGLIHSSSASSLVGFITSRLRETGDIVNDVSPSFLVRNWPPALPEWTTQSAKDAFFASPAFPRLLSPGAIATVVSSGVTQGLIGYATGKNQAGGFSNVLFNKPMSASQVEISPDTYILKPEEAQKYIRPPELVRLEIHPESVSVEPGKKQAFKCRGLDQHGRDIEYGSINWSASGGDIGKDGVFTAGKDEGAFIITAKSGKISGEVHVVVAKPGAVKPPTSTSDLEFHWSGELPHQKWMNFYTKVLSRFADPKTKMTLKIEVSAKHPEGITEQKIRDAKAGIEELGL